MTWEKKRVLITVKAYPERSKKHGTAVCTAGITDDGEWIRLYPLTMRSFSEPGKISKYDWIEVECKKASEKLGRKESYKVKEESIRIVDRSLSTTSPRGTKDWNGRNRIVMPLLASSIEELSERFDRDRTSLGLIKPKEIIDFSHDDDLKIYTKGGDHILNLSGQKIPIITEIPHIFRYKFICNGCKEGKKHSMTCEDWELLEAYRSWGSQYSDVDELWEKLYHKFLSNMMKNHNLYFYMGTESQYGQWLIIGLYYPPKQIRSGDGLSSDQQSIFDFS